MIRSPSASVSHASAIGGTTRTWSGLLKNAPVVGRRHPSVVAPSGVYMVSVCPGDWETGRPGDRETCTVLRASSRAFPGRQPHEHPAKCL